MTLVLEGIPSAGGPRSRRSRWGRVWFFLVFESVSFWLRFVMSVNG